jgi:predicted methyltransferase MtxX (methanogen marker protein 4)
VGNIEGNEMTIDQELHLLTLKNEFSKRVDKKYRIGQREHGGNLFDLTKEKLIEEAINECIDQFTYLMTLKEKLVK